MDESIVQQLYSTLGPLLEAAVAPIPRFYETVGRPSRVGEGYPSRNDPQEAAMRRAIARELVPIHDLMLINANAPVHISPLESDGVTLTSARSLEMRATHDNWRTRLTVPRIGTTHVRSAWRTSHVSCEIRHGLNREASVRKEFTSSLQSIDVERVKS